MLRHLKHVRIRFSPRDPAATSARQMLQQLGSDKSKASNPDCKFEVKVDESKSWEPALIELTFVDDDVRKLPAASYTSKAIEKLIVEKAYGLELKGVMTECKLKVDFVGDQRF